MRDILESFEWHSSIGIDSSIEDSKRFVTKLANNDKNKRNFVASGGNLLIHKATKALWKISEDKKSIEPVFDADVLLEDDLEEE
jgi:hypothetical protein